MNFNRNRVWLFGFAAILLSHSDLLAQKVDVWIGTGGKNGIQHTTLDIQTGELTPVRTAIAIPGTSFLVMHPNKPIIYSTAGYQGERGVAALAIKNQKLTLTNFLPSGDGGAAGVSVDRSGKVVFTAQNNGGSVTSYRLKSDGSLDSVASQIEHGEGSKVIPKRQDQSHPHWVGSSPDNRYLMVTDLGLDQVVIYEVDVESGKLTRKSAVQTPPGSGPRHMKFHPNGNFIFVLNEFTMDISVFGYSPESGDLKEIQLIPTLPKSLRDKNPNSAAEIRVHPSGKFVYASNRGHDSVAVFEFDESSGQLNFVEREAVRGANPRNFCLDPTGRWLLVGGRNSNTLTVFEINPKDGSLTYHRKCINVPTPMCVLIGSIK
ncbi:MAG: lactonase family protein [Planctomycetota bacterium]